MKSLAVAAAIALSACTAISEPNVQETKVAPFVVVANPIAAEAGMEVLERGGSAADAAIAIQATLSLVEPQSSGMGGGAFLHYFDASTSKSVVYDGREVAPAQATPSMFLDSSGERISFREAVVSGRSTGVPGAVAALALAHREHGKLDWSSLFGTPIKVASEGFIISPRMAKFLNPDRRQLQHPEARAYLSRADGSMMEAGDRLVNQPYADFLTRLAAQGPDALYKGSTAAKIIERTRQGELPGSLTMADFANYRVVKREPVCRPWQGYTACVPPPPSSGVGMLQLLALLERTDIASRGPRDPQSWYLFAEASRLMYADRDHYVGDVRTVPVDGLLDPDYVDARAKLIGPTSAENVEHGTPAGAPVHAADQTREPAGTSHFIVRDADGNVISMTTTVESVFGSGRMVDGFFLNNQLTDFSFNPVQDDGTPHPNAVAPGKRPRSSMVPMILIDGDGQFAGAIGSAGGNSILAYVGKSLVGAVMWDLPTQDALALPNLVARGQFIGGEVDELGPEVAAYMKARGIELRPGVGEDSGVHGVMIREGGRVDGGYDPRREGRVMVGTPR